MQQTQWVKDLTLEGVEPNPGPSYDEFINIMINKVPSEWQHWEPILNKLRQEIKRAYKLGFAVTLSHVEEFVDDPKNYATLERIGIHDPQVELLYEVFDQCKNQATLNQIYEMVNYLYENQKETSKRKEIEAKPSKGFKPQEPTPPKEPKKTAETKNTPPPKKAPENIPPKNLPETVPPKKSAENVPTKKTNVQYVKKQDEVPVKKQDEVPVKKSTENAPVKKAVETIPAKKALENVPAKKSAEPPVKKSVESAAVKKPAESVPVKKVVEKSSQVTKPVEKTGYQAGDWVYIQFEDGQIRARISSETETKGEWFVSLRKGSLQRMHEKYFVQ